MSRITIRMSKFLYEKILEISKETKKSKSATIKNLLKNQINEKIK